MAEINTATLADVVEVAHTGGSVLKSRFCLTNTSRQKQDGSLVTEADLASQDAVLAKIQALYPQDAIISEESDEHESPQPGRAVWVVDPLDGTTNFANDYPFFCCSVARGQYDAQGQIAVHYGAVYDPVHDQMFYAGQGLGAYLNGVKLQVRSPRPLNKCLLATGFYYNEGKQLAEDIERFYRVLGKCHGLRRDGSAALDLAYTAAGIYDAYWEQGLNCWDVAAGALLVTEAGGVVACLGEESVDMMRGLEGFDIQARSIIAGNKSTWHDLSRLLMEGL